MRSAYVLAAIIATLTVADAVACSCSPAPPPDKAFAAAGEVFEGKVVKVVDQYSTLRKAWEDFQRRVGRSSPMDWSTYEETHGFSYTFEVTRAWRGSARRHTRVLSGRGGGDCGIPFEKGKTYLVYAYCTPDRGCGTGICTRTAQAGRAPDDYRFLATRATLPLR